MIFGELMILTFFPVLNIGFCFSKTYCIFYINPEFHDINNGKLMSSGKGKNYSGFNIPPRHG